MLVKMSEPMEPVEPNTDNLRIEVLYTYLAKIIRRKVRQRPRSEDLTAM